MAKRLSKTRRSDFLPRKHKLKEGYSKSRNTFLIGATILLMAPVYIALSFIGIIPYYAKNLECGAHPIVGYPGGFKGTVKEYRIPSSSQALGPIVNGEYFCTEEQALSAGYAPHPSIVFERKREECSKPPVAIGGFYYRLPKDVNSTIHLSDYNYFCDEQQAIEAGYVKDPNYPTY